MKKGLKALILIITVLVLAVISYVIYVLSAYYRLPDKLTLEVLKSGDEASFEEKQGLQLDTVYKIMTYNIGFGAYTPEFTFFMDGGRSSWAKDKESVQAAVSNIGDFVNGIEPDFVLMQEIDTDGTRSYHVDELSLLNQFMRGYYYVFGQNYDSPYLIMPPWQPHGANKAGIITYSKREIKESMRRSLPISKSLSKFVDLDRCYTVSRIPMKDGRDLCIYNVHMSAYGNSDVVRKAQIEMLTEDMKQDYESGNYVICGGDFNHDMKAKMGEESQTSWAFPFPREALPEGFRVALDEADKEDIIHESCRNADEPYDENKSFTVTLDTFIISDNVKVITYENLDLSYKLSDHDPVVMEFILE